MNKLLLCPDCGSNDEIVNRCLYCGCQWEDTDSRIKEAIEEIDKYLKATIKRQDKYTGDQPYLVNCVITGIKRTRGILYKHFPEVREVKDE